MSGLFGSLSSASRALDAQRLGLDVVGQNIANVNTAGYSRRQLELAEVPPYGGLGAGGGVEVSGIRAARDMLLERRFRQELPTHGRAAAIAEALGIVEIALGAPGQSLDARLTAFFDAFSRLAAEPTSAIARQQVVLQGQSLASAFRDMDERLLTAQRDANARLVGAVDDVNGLLGQIAHLNVAIGGAGTSGAEVQHLVDQQGEALRRLSELVNVDVMPREHGGVDVTLGAGRPLVIGEVHYRLEAVQAPPSGLVDVVLGGATVNAEISAGRMGGLLHVRDTLIPSYRAELDAIAFATVQQVNQLHEAGLTLAGGNAGAFFTALPGPAGAASAIAVDAAIVADPSRVAAGRAPNGGADNTTARAIAALRDARVLAGDTATLHDAWGRLLYAAGTEVAQARADQKTRGEVVRLIENLRDATSGVSLDEEAMMMLKFQRAYEANARFFRTIDEAISTLITMLGR
jgi:flagellar hook-associated protein 1